MPSPPHQVQRLLTYVNSTRHLPTPGRQNPNYQRVDTSPGHQRVASIVHHLSQRNQSAAALGAMLANIRNDLSINHRSRDLGSASSPSLSLHPYSLAVGCVAGLFLLLTCGVMAATVFSLRRKRNVVAAEMTSSTPFNVCLTQPIPERRRRAIEAALEDLELQEVSLDVAYSGGSMTSLYSQSRDLQRRASSASTLVVDIENEADQIWRRPSRHKEVATPSGDNTSLRSLASIVNLMSNADTSLIESV